MVPLRSTGIRRPRVTPVMLLLLVTLGLVGVLTYQAVDAATSHRETAERALHDHATFAAWEYTRLARKELDWHVFNALKPLIYYAPANPAALPNRHQLEESRTKLANCDCGTPAFFRSYFAIDLKTGTAVWHDRKPDRAIAAWVRDTVCAHSAVYGERWESALLLGRVNGRLHVVAYSLRRDAKGVPRVASGALLDSTLIPAALGWPYEEAELLPRALTGEAHNQSVLNLVVRTTAGDEVYRGGAAEYPDAIAGSDTLGAVFGALTASVALNPAIASQLVIGGLPRSRVPLLLGLLALTAGLVAVTLRQLNKEYELARLRSDFVSGVSHELRTPLAQIRMFTETLALERIRSPEESQRALDIVVRESKRLSHLVDNVLQFSRAERGTMRLAQEALRLDLLLKDVVDGFRPLAGGRQVSLDLSTDGVAMATVDPAAVRQIVLNLLDNAVKYGPAGQTVHVTLGVDRGQAIITVEDEGPGIPAGARGRVWEPYWRLPRERDSAVGGSGIGLAVVKDLVHAHGGSVAIADGARGARFSVRFPCAAPDAAGATRSGAPASGRPA